MVNDEFARRLARIDERAKKGLKAEFAPLPEHPDEVSSRRKRGGGRGSRFFRRIVMLGAIGGGVFYYGDELSALARSELLASDNPFAEMIRSQMTAEDIGRAESDPDLSDEALRARGHKNPELARMLLSN